MSGAARPRRDPGTTARLQGKTVLVTGGGSGIGRGAAYAMADEGARIAVAGRTSKKCEETVEEIERRGGDAIAIEADVLRPDDIKRMVTTVLDACGRLDMVVHSAQTFHYAPLDVALPEHFDEMWQSGPLAALRLMQAALREARPRQFSSMTTARSGQPSSALRASPTCSSETTPSPTTCP